MVDTIIAHKQNSKILETLEEHSEKTEKYAKKLIKSNVFNNFDNINFQMIIDAIKYHDLGKINKGFQEKILNGKTNNSYSDHALMSIPYFIEKIVKNSNMDYIDEDLLGILLYLISKHHGSLDKVLLRDIFTYQLTESYTEKNSYLTKRVFDILEKHSDNFNYELDKYNMNIKKFEKLLDKLDEKIDYFDFFEKEYQDFFLIRFIHSLLISADYYATYEFFNQQEIKDFGRISDLKSFLKKFNNKYELMINDPEGSKQKINQIRTQLSFEALNNLKNALQDTNKYIFYLNAPTGAGKTLMSLNLLNAFENVEKIFYVFPFNTIIDQTAKRFSDYFKRGKDFEVINSISGIANEENLSTEELLLKRNMLHYPMILTSNVNFFNILYNNRKDSIFNFWQLQNSVVIFDEVQTFPVELWRPIIKSLEVLGKMFNIKFILMSATLPEKTFSKFVDVNVSSILLGAETLKIPEFKNRVEIKEDLLINRQYLEIDDVFVNDIIKVIKQENKDKVLIEFFTKKGAYNFYEKLKKLTNNDDEISKYKIYVITGDTNKIQRLRIIEQTKNSDKIILISTQVIEAGVDIDMDLGFKQTSIIESEEQFIGRINRNSKKKDAKVYLFDILNQRITNILKNDTIRTSTDFILVSPTMQNARSVEKFYKKLNILKEKDFDLYYQMISKKIFSRMLLEEDEFQEMFTFDGNMNFEKISNIMKIIKNEQISVYIPFKILLEPKKYKYEKELIEKFGFLIKDNILDGEKVFNYYMSITNNVNLKFSDKQIKLKQLQEIFNIFVINLYPDNFYKKLEKYAYQVYDDFFKINEKYLEFVWDVELGTIKEEIFY